MNARSSLWLVAIAAPLSLAACSGSSGGGGDSNAIKNPVQAYVVDNSVLAFAAIARTRLLLPLVLVPGMHAAAGITFTPRVNPNAYDYVIPLDSDGNGSKETTLTGTIEFSSDPFAGGALVAGFQATVDLTVTTNSGMGVFDADIEAFFDVNGGFRISGTGTYDDAQTGSTVILAVDAGHPLHIRTASNKPDQKPNACIWNVDGAVHVDASNADGDYSADWDFKPASTLIHVLNATFKQPGGGQKALPDTKFEAGPCPGKGKFGDWAGNFTFDWFCIPTENGQSEITITVINDNTIEIMDEDPPGSGSFLTYRAKRDANDPHVVHGSFKENTGGGTYEEDFTWVLSPNSNTFKQVSEYFYLNGPMAGSGGDCGGVGVRN
jgi:hypothetical protein